MLPYRFLAWIGPFTLLCLGGCRVAQPAFFSPAQPAYTPSLMQAPDRATQAAASAPLPIVANSDEPVEPYYSSAKPQQKVAGPARVSVARPTTSVALPVGAPVRHGNPDLSPPRRAAWLYTSQLMTGSQTSYTANQIIPDELPSKRRVPRGVFYALAGSALPYGFFLFSPLAPWVWVLSLTLPLASMLVATGSLSKIRRNKTQFRGRGWAALALVLATSYVGMALVTLAALATSGILWE
jgi:hypothetical protein